MSVGVDDYVRVMVESKLEGYKEVLGEEYIRYIKLVGVVGIELNDLGLQLEALEYLGKKGVIGKVKKGKCKDVKGGKHDKEGKHDKLDKIDLGELECYLKCGEEEDGGYDGTRDSKFKEDTDDDEIDIDDIFVDDEDDSEDTADEIDMAVESIFVDDEDTDEDEVDIDDIFVDDEDDSEDTDEDEVDIDDIFVDDGINSNVIDNKATNSNRGGSRVIVNRQESNRKITFKNEEAQKMLYKFSRITSKVAKGIQKGIKDINKSKYLNK